MIEARWSDLGVFDWRRDEVITHRCLSGDHEHPLYLFDETLARRLIERCRELGGSRFRLSADLANMIVAGHLEWSMHGNGFESICDPTLPPNSVVAAGDS